MNVLDLLCVAAGVCAALVGGVFFAFSTFVMRALADLPATEGIAAMQRINVVVINPLFLGVFLGTAPLLAGAVYVASDAAGGQAFGWLLTACILYVAGSIGVTLACNVPLNDRLAAASPRTEDAAAFWPVYVERWLRWNHVRCVASLAAAAAAILAVTR